MVNISFKRDAAERILATAAQAVGGILTAEMIMDAVELNASLENVLKIALITALAGLKAWAAKKIGNPEDASFLRQQ